MRRLRSKPLLHFVLGGVLLFGVVHTIRIARHRDGAPIGPVVLTVADVAQLRRDHARDTGTNPSPADEAGLVERAIEEELLFREAVARGLDRDRSVRNWLVEQVRALDPDTTAGPDALFARAQALELDRTDLVVRRMLVQKMRMLAARENEHPPSDEALHAYYARHAAEYRAAERVSLWHVFLSSRAAGNAEGLLAELRRDAVAPATAAQRGDTFSAPPYLRAQSAADLARYFGAPFAEALASLPTATWAGPIASPHGVHLVWIERRTPASAPVLDDIRGQLRERWLDEQRTQRLEDLLRSLKIRYPLQIESAAWHERSAT
jgi:hypothetical protein